MAESANRENNGKRKIRDWVGSFTGDYADIFDELPPMLEEIQDRFTRTTPVIQRAISRSGQQVYRNTNVFIRGGWRSKWHSWKSNTKEGLKRGYEQAAETLSSWMFFSKTAEPRLIQTRDGKVLNPIYPSVRQTKLHFNSFLRKISFAEQRGAWKDAVKKEVLAMNLWFIDQTHKSDKKAFVQEVFKKTMLKNIRDIVGLDDKQYEREVARYLQVTKEEIRHDLVDIFGDYTAHFITGNPEKSRDVGNKIDVVDTWFSPAEAFTFIQVLHEVHQDSLKNIPGAGPANDELLLRVDHIQQIEKRTSDALVSEVERLTKNLQDVEFSPAQHFLRLYQLVRDPYRTKDALSMMRTLEPVFIQDIRRLKGFEYELNATLVQEQIVSDFASSIAQGVESVRLLQKYFGSASGTEGLERVYMEPYKQELPLTLKRKIISDLSSLDLKEKEDALEALHTCGLYNAVLR
jgi:hypothetical protein